MKRTILLATAAILLLTSCGGEKDTKNASGSTSSSSSADGDGVKYKDAIGTNAGEYEGLLGKILDKAGAPDAEILEINSTFNAVSQFHKEVSGYYSVQIVNPKDKNKIVAYNYAFPAGTITGPTDVELTQGVGSSEKFIDTYDGFKEHLFRKSDFDMSKIPAMRKDAMERAAKDYGDKCFVEHIDLERDINGKGEVRAYVSVQSTRSITASKYYYYNTKGEMVD